MVLVYEIFSPLSRPQRCGDFLPFAGLITKNATATAKGKKYFERLTQAKNLFKREKARLD